MSEPAKVGRPTDYKPEYCELLIEHMSKGLSFEAFGGIVRKSKQTLYDWLQANPEFLDAKMTGTELSRLFWEKLGTDHVLNISESSRSADGSTSSMSKSLNASIWIFNMKNRFKDEWREKQELDVSSDKGITIKIDKEDEKL
jgi:hypothetical protein